jgi:hypothetical protein
MPWVRLSDDFYDHPKFIQAGPLGLGVWISGLAYCNRNLTDGVISESTARRLCDFDGLSYETGRVGDMASFGEDVSAEYVIELLINADLWHTRGHTCHRCPQPPARHLIFHDYLDYQPSADEVGKKSAIRSEAGKKGAAARWDGKPDAISHGKSDGTSDAIGMRSGWQNYAPNPNPNPKEKDSPSTPAKIDRFDDFWDNFPKKVSKGAAVKAWRSAVKKADAETIIDAARIFAASVSGSDPKFIPYPATWLNGERWADDAEAEQAEERPWWAS